MFTYREFADGAHLFRQRLTERRDDAEYEEARADNELAILELSRISDPVELGKILSYLETLVDRTEKINSTSYEDCVRMSTLFTYFKIIAQTCGIARTHLDKIYKKMTLNFGVSSGGLIFVLEPAGTDNLLPRVRVKIPISITLGKIRTTIHDLWLLSIPYGTLFHPSLMSIRFGSVGHSLILRDHTMTVDSAVPPV